MTVWGGAQWLVIFYFALRAVLHALRLYGILALDTSKLETRSPVAAFFGTRFADAASLAVLWWGGFFG